MNKKLIAMIALTFSLSLFSAEHPFKKDRLILKLKDGQTPAQFSEITKSQKLFGNLYIIHTKDAEQFKKSYSKHPSVDYIELDYYAGKRKLATEVKTIDEPVTKGTRTPFNDPKVGKIWSFKDSEEHGISINRAYQRRAGFNQKEIIVAVVDTGVDFNHVELKDVMWVNENEIPGNGIDDDQNGYVDDVHGINTLQRDQDGNATGNIMDGHGHGTHVSGTIGAKQNNGIGIAGIASKVKIMGIRTVPNSGDETDIDVIESFVYAAKNGAKIINCSFGKSHNEGGMAVSETIEHIGNEYGVLVVAAAGNSSQNIDRRLTYPASFENENLLVVASTSRTGGMSYFSNYGEKNVDLAAPGSSIYSLKPGNGYTSMSGTSMASPTTAGVAAEVLSHYPNLAPVKLKEILMESVVKLGRFGGKMASGGRVDLDKALELAAQ